MRADIHDGREPKRSNQRPDTLMQDRIRQIDEIPCTTRPDHTLGSQAGVRAMHSLSLLHPQKPTYCGRSTTAAWCRFCCRSRLKAIVLSDSVAVMRFATGAEHDGAAEPRSGAIFLFISAWRGGAGGSPGPRDCCGFSANWYKIDTFSPSTKPVCLRPCRK